MKTIPTLLVVGVVLAGCSGSMRDIISGDSDVDVDFTLAKLAGIEEDTQFGLYEFISNSQTDNSNDIMRICHGVLLMDDRGVCKFESLRKTGAEPFWVYFNPQDEIVVVFPESKTAYRASASLFQDPETHRILATYDAVRLILGLSDVWSNPDQNQLDKKRFGNRVEFQSPGRPYRWEVDLDESGSTAPFAELQAKSGRDRLTTVSRKTTSMSVYDSDSTRKFGSGMDSGGFKIDTNLWQVEMEGGVRQTQLQFTPYPKNAINRERLGAQLGAVKLDKDYQVEDLTKDRLKRWLDLR